MAGHIQFSRRIHGGNGGFSVDGIIYIASLAGFIESQPHFTEASTQPNVHRSLHPAQRAQKRFIKANPIAPWFVLDSVAFFETLVRPGMFAIRMGQAARRSGSRSMVSKL